MPPMPPMAPVDGWVEEREMPGPKINAARVGVVARPPAARVRVGSHTSQGHPPPYPAPKVAATGPVP